MNAEINHAASDCTSEVRNKWICIPSETPRNADPETDRWLWIVSSSIPVKKNFRNFSLPKTKKTDVT
jgi:hypothetical protein